MQALHHNRDRRPRKILFIGEGVSLAHVGRPLVLAEWARLAGYRTVLACGETYSNLAQGTGIETLPLFTIPRKRFFDRLHRGRFFYNTEELAEYVDAECELIQRVKPDLVVGDFRLSLPLSANLMGVPMLVLQQAHWSPHSEARLPLPDWGRGNGLTSLFATWTFPLVRPLAYRFFARPLDILRRRLGLPARKDFRRNYVDGDFCAFLDLPELSPVRVLDPNQFYLGPVYWQPPERKEAMDELMAKIGARLEPLAFVSAGSSGDEAATTVAIRTLLTNGFQVVATGSHSKRESLGDLQGDPRLHLEGMINPSRLLGLASLAVCHGGHGTIYQIMSAGVPLLCLPSNPDQIQMSGAVERFGLGISLRPLRLASRKLSGAVDELMNGNGRQRAENMALALTTHNTQAHWLAWLSEHFPIPRTRTEAIRDRGFRTKPVSQT